MNRFPVITVDGPSGVGKGVVLRHLSTRLGWHRLDSGALYRILALHAQNLGVDLADVEAVAALAPALDIHFSGDDEDSEVITVNGVNQTARIRLESTGALASKIATAPSVRTALLQRQRDFRQAPGLIADGRDMGTVVFPDAACKFFLDASPEARAERRFKQLSRMGVHAILDNLLVEIRERDDRDRNRATAPLKAADDAVVIDTTHLSATEVVAVVERTLQPRFHA
jgi:cytidylate kinase